MTREELLAQMEKLAEAGDEKAFEAFALEHFKEFPEDVQGSILFGLFGQALEKQAGEAAIADIQKQGLEAMEEIDAIRAEASKGE